MSYANLSRLSLPATCSSIGMQGGPCTPSASDETGADQTGSGYIEQRRYRDARYRKRSDTLLKTSTEVHELTHADILVISRQHDDGGNPKVFASGRMRALYESPIFQDLLREVLQTPMEHGEAPLVQR